MQSRPAQDRARNQASFFRSQLRAARAKALADAEDFHDLVTTMERIAGALLGAPTMGFEDCRKPLLGLIEDRLKQRPSDDRWGGVSARSQFDMLRLARNDAMHVGSRARHLTDYAVEFAILVEEALVSELNEVRHFMVKGPIVAEEYHPLLFVRQIMLSKSFSYLPIQLDGRWGLLSDYELARLTRTGKDRECLQKTVREAVEDRLLRIDETDRSVSPRQKVQDLLKAETRREPWLVVEDGHLVGILTTFDLL